MQRKKLLISVGIAAVALLGVSLGSRHYFQTHFHRHVTINGINVGGLTAAQAYEKVSQTKLTNRVYLNGKLVFDGHDQEPVFAKDAKQTVARQLQKQATWFPSRQPHAYTLPLQMDQAALRADMKATLHHQLGQLNGNKRLPVDAKAVWHANRVTVTPAKHGTAYDEAKVMAALRRHQNEPTIKLTAKVQQPLEADSLTVKKAVTALKKLNNGQVTYQVAGHPVKVKASQVIDKATYQAGKYHFTPVKEAAVIKQLNAKYATLGKKFKFTTHAGNTITTTADGDYGWKIMASRAATTIGQAIVAGRTQVDAKADIYGQGYDTRGLGYGVTKNDGLGDTYAEVSIADQHAWFYRDGKLVASADVVTGKHSSGDDTPKGVWYVMYQQMHTTLRGTGDDGKPYASPVTYWTPFTLSGCGFHDASWRKNWSKTAYLTDGSNGCVNMHPADAGVAFKALSNKEPVIVY